MSRKLCGDAQKFLKAHFLRLTCPLNYILTPKADLQLNYIKIPKNDVGELKELQAYAMEQFGSIYGNVYKDYLSLLMLPKQAALFDPGAKIIDVEYGFHVKDASKLVSGHAQQLKPKTSKTDLPIRSKTEESDITNQIAIKYLTDPNTSFRKLEIEIMKIESPSHGGGFKAKKIVNDMGITADMKGILSQISVDEFLARYSNVSPIVKQLLKRG